MIYTELTKRALRFAYDAHHGQLDKGGLPYINHPLHVAERMKDENACAVALLHDVIEDTATTPEELRAQFPATVCDAVEALTRRPGEDYFDYVRRAGANPLARAVKLADLAHNLDATRTAPESVSAERMKKYRRARRMLLAMREKP